MKLQVPNQMAVIKLILTLEVTVPVKVKAKQANPNIAISNLANNQQLL